MHRDRGTRHSRAHSIACSLRRTTTFETSSSVALERIFEIIKL